MGRKQPNIKQQLQNRIDGLTRFGEKKVKDDPTNPNRAEGIHSVKTCESYRATARLFGDYLKQEHVRNIDDITREHVQGFMHTRENLSPYTYSRELSAINKMLDTRYTVREFDMRGRSHHNIQNNRGLSQCDTSQAERNRQALEFAHACGMRRSSIDRVTPADFIRNSSGQCIGVHLLEKGGKERDAIILQQYRDRITLQVDNAIQQTGLTTPFLKEPDHNANPHYERGEYARELYADLMQAGQAGYDYYDGMRDRFINDEYYSKACERYKDEYVRGYERDTMAEVSQNLGHNRIDVVLYHYLLR